MSCLRDKSEDLLLGPELRPEYVEEAKGIEKQRVIKVGSLKNLRKRYE